MRMRFVLLSAAAAVLVAAVTAQYTEPFYADLQVVWPEPRSWEKVFEREERRGRALWKESFGRSAVEGALWEERRGRSALGGALW